MQVGIPARAHASSTQTLNAAASTLIALDTGDFDAGNLFVPASNRFAPVQAGYYLVCGAVRATSTAAGQSLFAQIFTGAAGATTTWANGSGVFSQATSESFVGAVSDIVELGPTDVVELHAFSSAAIGTLAGATNVYMSIALLA